MLGRRSLAHVCVLMFPRMWLLLAVASRDTHRGEANDACSSIGPVKAEAHHSSIHGQALRYDNMKCLPSHLC